MTELLPTQGIYASGTTAYVEVRELAGPAVLTVTRLGEPVSGHQVDAPALVGLPLLAPGGYGVELSVDGVTVARTALEVSDRPRQSLRYGFVVDFRPGRDLAAVADNLRRLHLTGVQFYDWAYRHADLLGGGETYDDALGQPVSLDTVRSLVATCHEVGAEALGYAAVYAVGPQEWAGWEHDALLTAGGVPYALGDFLFIVDPAAKDWLEHLRCELSVAAELLGFDGFHLDQYGYPKRARRADGELVDVADSFVAMIGAVRRQLPLARLIFNNVNDFPTWATATTDQDAVYVEVWAPNVALEHLAQVVTRARSAGTGKPVVVAAYQHVYDSAPAAVSDLSTALTMATLFSHGATHLLCGEADRILVDPYYVRNHVVESSTAALLKRWYDFLVEHTELLMPQGIADVTGSYCGLYNDDLDVTYELATVAEHAAAGTVWRRITQVGDRLVVHLVNLTGQENTLWDAPRHEPGSPGPGTMRIRRAGPDLPRVRVADPDRQARLVDVEVVADGDFATATLPAPYLWQVVLVDPAGRSDRETR
ncbi:MAG: dextranase [Frankiales bacterium]|nr:dextranase [Frankiales bacterium]